MLSATEFQKKKIACEHKGYLNSKKLNNSFIPSGVQCENPVLSEQLTRSNFSCSVNYGSSFAVRCKNDSHVMMYNNQSRQSLRYLCTNEGVWIPPIQFMNISCIYQDRAAGDLGFFDAFLFTYSKQLALINC